MKDKAESTINHANRTISYYDDYPDKIKEDGGVESVIDELKARIGRRDIREMITWEIHHEVNFRTFKPARDDWPYQEALEDFRTRHTPKSRSKILYASGQKERAKGVEEYLKSRGEKVKFQFLPDGERKRGRRYVIVEQAQTQLRSVS